MSRRYEVTVEDGVATVWRDPVGTAFGPTEVGWRDQDGLWRFHPEDGHRVDELASIFMAIENFEAAGAS